MIYFVYVPILLSSLACYAMAEPQQAKRLMAILNSTHPLMDAKIKDNSIPLSILVKRLTEFKGLLDKHGPSLTALDVESYERFKKLYHKTCNNLIALTLLDKQKQRQDRKAPCDVTMWMASVAAHSLPIWVCFFPKYQDCRLLLSTILLDLHVVGIARYKKLRIKAEPKPTLFDAISCVLPHVKHSPDLDLCEVLKPELPINDHLRNLVTRLEEEYALLKLIINIIPDKRKKESAIEPPLKIIKAGYAAAKSLRDVNAVLRLAILKKSFQELATLINTP